MMKCKAYIFQLTSGQLAQAPLATRMEAQAHRLMCRHCRAFTSNDKALSTMLEAYKDKLSSPRK
jgi:hypothetical protein